MRRPRNLQALNTSTTDIYDLHALAGLDRVRSPDFQEAFWSQRRYGCCGSEEKQPDLAGAHNFSRNSNRESLEHAAGVTTTISALECPALNAEQIAATFPLIKLLRDANSSHLARRPSVQLGYHSVTVMSSDEDGVRGPRQIEISDMCNQGYQLRRTDSVITCRM